MILIGWKRRLPIALAAAFGLLGLLWMAERIAIDRAIAIERARLANVAALASNNFRRQVDMFQLVATTLSADPELLRVLSSGDPASITALNRRMALLSTTLDASVIYLMDRAGTTVVSSNWRQPDSFLGENYRFRPYFRRAMRQGEASQFALGTRSRIPGLFLARRIDEVGDPLGVLVVKIRFDRLEREWARSIGEAFVVDPNGVILVTSDPDLRFQTVAVVSSALRSTLRARQEFGSAPLTLHPEYATGAVLTDGTWRGQRMLQGSAAAAGGRRIIVLSPVEMVATSARNVARLAVGLVTVALLAGALGVAAYRRSLTARAREVERIYAESLKARLERANRLSSLGQVAAGVGHEINQPLAAIGIRADSAAKLLAAGRVTEAGTAVGQISGLVARIGVITQELRQFARRADRILGAVRLRAAFDGLSVLMGDTLRRNRAEVVVRFDDERIAVVAEQTRLEQVLVNLVQNALDAGGEGTRIDIAVEATADRVRIGVSDNGPGIEAAVADQLFQPFKTSKADGLGLGLVISRDIVAEFGGTLSLHSEPGCGAVFVIDLERAA